MSTPQYLMGRKKYSRPQAILFSNNQGTLVGGQYVPDGYEVGTDSSQVANPSDANQFVILSDHGRGPLGFSVERIEKRDRMINGRMRSYHVADKLKLSVTWDSLPSRSYSTSPDFDATTGKSSDYGLSGLRTSSDLEYTVDGGAGGVEILKWYESHHGSFWVFLAYDNYDNFDGEQTKYGKLAQYNEVVEMFISDFSYSVEKRGGSNFDFWNISMTLEEA